MPYMSRPSRARELKLFAEATLSLRDASRPSRARELKPCCPHGRSGTNASRPSRARELKQRFAVFAYGQRRVAPLAGA